MVTTANESQYSIFAQNSTSTLGNGTNVSSINPNSESIVDLLAIGIEAENLGNYIGAIEYYDKVLAIDPNEVNATYNKGSALDSLGNYTGAIEYYDRVLAINPNDVDALNSKGVSLDNLGNYTQAMEYYDKVLSIDPNDVDALNSKAALVNLGIQPAQASTGDDSNDNNGSSGSDNDDNGHDGDDNDSKQDNSNGEEDETEDEYEETNPLRDQIRNEVNEKLSASGIGVP
jgi:tetratricopeptide (TPR) repeat protein